MEISKDHGEACSHFDPHLKVYKCPGFALYLLPEGVSAFCDEDDLASVHNL